MPLIAVAANRHAYGVEDLADDWLAPQGDPRNERRIERDGRLRQIGIASPYRVEALENALATEHTTDAHFVCYVLRDRHGAPVAMQPRLNKPGLATVATLGHQVTIEVLAADLDNAEHCDWTDELLEQARAQDAQLLAMGAGVYYTSHGRRVVASLARPLVVGVDDVEGILAGWLAELERVAGVHPDPSCRDWTRHFRLPHVRRSGRAYRSPIVLLDAMKPIEPPPPVKAGPWARRRSSAALGPVGDVAGSPLARAFEASGWLGRSLGAGKVAVLCPWASEHTSGRDYDSSTILFGPSQGHPAGWFHCSHGHCARRRQSELRGALPLAARVHLDDDQAPASTSRPREYLSPDEARARLEDAFRNARDGLQLVVAGCGTGKTQAALVVAGERALKAYATDDAQGKRAPANSKTSITVPTTRLAAELAERVRAQGTSVRRLFGPLSVRRPDGEPECRYHEQATALARASLSVPWELCEGRGREPCDYADVCTARGGVEGPDDARVLIAPHAMIATASAWAGTTGLLVVDEPPDLLAHVTISLASLRAAQVDLGRYYDYRYAAALRVSLRALEDWIQRGPLDVPGPLARGVEVVDQELLEEAYNATGEADPIDCARAAFEPGHKGKTPPVSRSAVHMARRSLGIARQIGEAGRVARLVHLGLTCEKDGVIVRIEERRGERVLVVSTGNLDLRDALKRDGACVVADANGRLHLPLYARIVGYAPPVVEVHARDGANVQRTVVRTRATRSGWAPRGRLEVGPTLVRAIRAAVDWALEDGATQRIGIVTLEVLELALRAGLGEDVAEAWIAKGQDAAVLDDARRLLGPELARLPLPPDLGHYGAIRGLDHWRDHDAVITLGDPWGLLTDARHEAELLELGSWESRYETVCAAELEQAHGRLRTVHRTRDARALHVGAVLPGGWQDAEVRELRYGRPRGVVSMTAGELTGIVEALGGVRSAAREMGFAPGALGHYLAGRRVIGPEMADRARRCTPKVLKIRSHPVYRTFGVHLPATGPLEYTFGESPRRDPEASDEDRGVTPAVTRQGGQDASASSSATDDATAVLRARRRARAGRDAYVSPGTVIGGHEAHRRSSLRDPPRGCGAGNGSAVDVLPGAFPATVATRRERRQR